MNDFKLKLPNGNIYNCATSNNNSFNCKPLVKENFSSIEVINQSYLPKVKVDNNTDLKRDAIILHDRDMKKNHIMCNCSNCPFKKHPFMRRKQMLCNYSNCPLRTQTNNELNKTNNRWDITGFFY